MPEQRIFTTKFSKVYPLYLQKAKRKNRSKKEVDFETFFTESPGIHPNSSLIKGLVCGVRVEGIDDPLMRKIRYLDKLIDELAKGGAMDKILRQ